jgi:Protein of unknown function (DUF3237)
VSVRADLTPVPVPGLERVADGVVELGSPIDLGETPGGRRRLIPILGGALFGPRLFGKVLPGGADFQLVVSPSLVRLEARYVFETEQGERVYIENQGVRFASAEVIARLNRGEAVDPELVYCRTHPRFETAAPALSWLMTQSFVGSVWRAPDHVQIAFFRVL